MFFLKLYDSLTRNDSVQPVDMIFVLAGRMERKHYGLELYRKGVAPQLVLSVGRFEVSKMASLHLDSVNELIELRDRTPADERHFFVTLDTSANGINKIVLSRCSTYGEGLAFREYLGRKTVRRVMVISTAVHLRRVALTFAKIFHDVPVDFIYCPVPSRFGFLQRTGWWNRRDDRRFVISEMIKLAGYRMILSTPAWAIHHLMRLKDTQRLGHNE